MNNPEYIKVGDKKYKINTDFKIALKCQDIAMDTSISGYEKEIGIVYTLFNIKDNIDDLELETLLKYALKYLMRGNEEISKNSRNSKIDMDYKKDWGLIVSSMWQQYGIDINKENIHWWTFFDLLNGLSSECVLNKVREIRNKDLSEIKDEKLKKEYAKLKEQYKLEQDEHELSEKEKESVETFYRLTGIERK